jgi:cytochrome P450
MFSSSVRSPSCLYLLLVLWSVCVSVIAGYESTSTALGYITYLLATNSTEQKKLQEEIDAHIDQKTDDTMSAYDTVSEMKYLDMVIRETLRGY